MKKNKEELMNEIKKILLMIYDSYGVLNHYEVELIEDVLNDCLIYLQGVKK